MTQVDILLATFNGDNFLAEQIDSIINQSYTGWKLFIRDDGSTDGTNEIIQTYQNKFPNKVFIVTNNNGNAGVIANFSELLTHSSSPYIMFCDQDDTWLADKIQLALEKMQEVEQLDPSHPILVHTDLKVVNSDLTILSNSYWSYQRIEPHYDTLNRLLVQNIITGCTVMINRELAELALPIPKDVIMHDWWIALIAASFGHINHINTPTVLYRQHSNNDTGATYFGLYSIVKKIQSLSTVDLQKYTVQAKLLLAKHKDRLSPGQVKLLKEFISTQKASWIKAKYILLKYGIIKQGFVRNMGLFLCR